MKSALTGLLEVSGRCRTRRGYPVLRRHERQRPFHRRRWHGERCERQLQSRGLRDGWRSQIAPLPGNATPIVNSLNAIVKPGTYTPSTRSPTRCHRTRQSLGITLHPDHTVSVVLATDGEPNAVLERESVRHRRAKPGTDPGADRAGGENRSSRLQRHAEDPDVRDWNHRRRRCACPNLDPAPPNAADLNAVAKAGGTNSAFIVNAAAADTSAQFLDRLETAFAVQPSCLASTSCRSPPWTAPRWMQTRSTSRSPRAAVKSRASFKRPMQQAAKPSPAVGTTRTSARRRSSFARHLCDLVEVGRPRGRAGLVARLPDGHRFDQLISRGPCPALPPRGSLARPLPLPPSAGSLRSRDQRRCATSDWVRGGLAPRGSLARPLPLPPSRARFARGL